MSAIRRYFKLENKNKWDGAESGLSDAQWFPIKTPAAWPLFNENEQEKCHSRARPRWGSPEQLYGNSSADFLIISRCLVQTLSKQNGLSIPRTSCLTSALDWSAPSALTRPLPLLVSHCLGWALSSQSSWISHDLSLVQSFQRNADGLDHSCLKIPPTALILSVAHLGPKA